MSEVNKCINTLGVDGYSSEDTDFSDGGTPIYIVKILDWRDEKVLRVVVPKSDDSHPRKNINGNRTSGSDQTPRLRLRTANISTRKAPRKLPINLYRQMWYANLTESERVALDAGPPQSFPGEEDDYQHHRYY